MCVCVCVSTLYSRSQVKGPELFSKWVGESEKVFASPPLPLYDAPLYDAPLYDACCLCACHSHSSVQQARVWCALAAGGARGVPEGARVLPLHRLLRRDRCFGRGPGRTRRGPSSCLHHACTTPAPRLHLPCTTPAQRLHHACTTPAPRLHHACTVMSTRSCFVSYDQRMEGW